jgi:hypothetical protein
MDNETTAQLKSNSKDINSNRSIGELGFHDPLNICDIIALAFVLDYRPNLLPKHGDLREMLIENCKKPSLLFPITETPCRLNRPRVPPDVLSSVAHVFSETKPK